MFASTFTKIDFELIDFVELILDKSELNVK